MTQVTQKMAKKAANRVRGAGRREFPDDHMASVTELIIPGRKTKARKREAGPTMVPERAPTRAPLVCKNKAQTNYKQKIESSTVTFGVGPAGTGKSYVALKVAAAMLDNGDIKRIIASRPAIGVEEDLGALPGTLEEKAQPWFQPLIDVLEEHYGRCHVEGMIHSKRLLFVPISHLRGRTFNDSFILLDEAQNCTPKQMKALLTRTGRFSRVVIDGDLNQSDIQGENGLWDAISKLRKRPEFAFQVFAKSDVVRSDIVRVILDAYEPELEHDRNYLAVNSD